MKVVVPGRGWCCTLRGAPAAVYYGVLGPFSEGTYLRSVSLWVGGDLAHIAEVGVVLGASGEASEVAYEAGRSLIDRSVSYNFGSPSIILDVGVGLSEMVVLCPGVRISSGSRYCIVMFGPGAGPVRAELVAVAEVVEIEEVD